MSHGVVKEGSGGLRKEVAELPFQLKRKEPWVDRAHFCSGVDLLRNRRAIGSHPLTMAVINQTVHAFTGSLITAKRMWKHTMDITTVPRFATFTQDYARRYILFAP